MYLDKILTAVQTHLRKGLEELKDNEIQISPEGRPWPTAGQKFLAIHSTTYHKLNPPTNPMKRYRINFAITYNLRIRDVPVDRLKDPAYLNIFTGLTNILEKCILLLDQTDSFHAVLRDAIPNTAYFTNGKTFMAYMDPDPTHLSPDYFYSDDNESSDRLAGYKMTVYFNCPILNIPPTEACP